MHEAALLRAVRPEPAVVLGMLLRPLSIGHIVTLTGSGVLDEGCTFTPELLAESVLTCCQSWDQAAGIYSDVLLPFKLWIWKRRVEKASKRHMIFGTGGTYFQEESLKFATYIRAGSTDFPISDAPRPDSTPSRTPGAPFTLRLHQFIMTNLRLTESQAWDYPFGLAKMRWACHWEAEGGIDIQNEHDSAFDRFIAEQEALAEEKLKWPAQV